MEAPSIETHSEAPETDYYFDGYSHFSIHEEMLKDKIRTQCYKRAIMDNPHLFENKIVLDVGSGTGVLSIFAAKSGAKHVYGIEKAKIYLHSREIVEENGLTDKITIINGLVEEVELPVDKVDIIISEWMGYFLLYESMLDSVLFARDKWLAPDGLLFPDRVRMYVAALDDTKYFNHKLVQLKKTQDFWNSVHGVSMKCIRQWVISEPLVDPIDPDRILSNNAKFFDIQLSKITPRDLDFQSQCSLDIELQGNINGFVTWFTCSFSHGRKKITLSTSPYMKQTHWKQTIFYYEPARAVAKNDLLALTITVAKAKRNKRELDVSMAFKLNKADQGRHFYRVS